MHHVATNVESSTIRKRRPQSERRALKKLKGSDDSLTDRCLRGGDGVGGRVEVQDQAARNDGLVERELGGRSI